MQNIEAVNNIINSSKRRLLKYAIMRPESAILLTFSTLMVLCCLFRLYWYPEMGWFWLLLGVVGEAVIIYTTIKDTNSLSKITSQVFYKQYGPNSLITPELRRMMSAALSYHREIFAEVSRRRDSTGLGDIAIEMDSWVVHLFRVVQGIDSFLKNPQLVTSLPDVSEKRRNNRRALFESLQAYTHALDKTASIEKDNSKRMLLAQVKTALVQSKNQADQSMNSVSEFHKQLKHILPENKDDETLFLSHAKEVLGAQLRVLARCGEGMESLFRFACVAL